MNCTVASAVQEWKQTSQALKRETFTLFLAYRDPRTPWYAKAFTGLVVAYAFSPLDLIPDFIPVLGYLDDLLLVPLGVTLAIKIIPAQVMDKSRAAAHKAGSGKPVSRVATVAIVMLWIGLAWLSLAWILGILT